MSDNLQDSLLAGLKIVIPEEPIKELLNSTFDKPWGNYLLEKFVETPLPKNVSWMPVTVGWWLVLAVIVAVCAWKLTKAYQYYQANAYRREALSWLARADRQNMQTYSQLPALLKQVAMAGYGREQVAALTGAEWETWLDNKCVDSCFSSEAATYLATFSYGDVASTNQGERQLVFLQVQTWVEKHRGLHD